MSLAPGSPPRTPRTPPYSAHSTLAPGSAPQTPTRGGDPHTASPRPPASPMRRPLSQVSLRSPTPGAPPSTSASGASSLVASRRGSGHGLPPSASTSALGLGLDTGAPGGGGGGGARAGTPGTPQKARARDLLRKHYGLGMGPPPPLGAGKSSQDPMDFDSVVFDAKAYYEQLITTSSLPTLIKKENDLLTEIRQLDSERQSLVYNHHHELIAASDTIAAMKSRAENLDADLDLLRAAFSEISRLSAEIAIEHQSPTERRPPQPHSTSDL
ncbi:Vps51/Vps67-domain-containing protein [Epithele typhae]|uniref:Vps51/Vps67-domain-containing protein n=1 Tax=Epithele typhae TaxID=378194 RepID=UPI0020079206|nr:Vps51/Vps67-domain-containing protein [Epithele typhae]KAH9945366.1 Vps51/Vps67-domain-containing protein [Epithele typhae]